MILVTAGAGASAVACLACFAIVCSCWYRQSQSKHAHHPQSHAHPLDHQPPPTSHAHTHADGQHLQAAGAACSHCPAAQQIPSPDASVLAGLVQPPPPAAGGVGGIGAHMGAGAPPPPAGAAGACAPPARTGARRSSMPVPLDTTGDGRADSVGVDADGDGKVDTIHAAVPIDTTGDGFFDSLGFDSTGDGRVDATVLTYHMLHVTLPADGSVEAGHKMAVVSPDGRPFEASVPAGVAPGCAFHIRVPVLPMAARRSMLAAPVPMAGAAAATGVVHRAAPQTVPPAPVPMAGFALAAAVVALAAAVVPPPSPHQQQRQHRHRQQPQQTTLLEPSVELSVARRSRSGFRVVLGEGAVEAEGAYHLECDDETPEEALAKAFRIMDSDSSGAVSRYEIVKACGASERVRTLLGLPATMKKTDGSRDKLNALMERLDADSDGKVSLAEFQRVFCPTVSSWLTALAVVAEPVEEEDRRTLRHMQQQSRALSARRRPTAPVDDGLHA